MREAFEKLQVAIDAAKKQSKDKIGPVLVKQVKMLNTYIIDDSVSLDMDEDLVCSFQDGIKSIWPPHVIESLRKNASK